MDVLEQTVEYAHTKYILAIESKLRSLFVSLNQAAFPKAIFIRPFPIEKVTSTPPGVLVATIDIGFKQKLLSDQSLDIHIQMQEFVDKVR